MELKKIYCRFTLLLFCLLMIVDIPHSFAQNIINPTDSLKSLPKAYRHRQGEMALRDSLTADSIREVNKRQLQLTGSHINASKLNADSLKIKPRPIFVPNSAKATWLAAIFPGAGQIYNRKYWKLPIIYGGFVACAYALSWNGKYYKNYSQAYKDIMDNDPTTTSYLNYLPLNYTVDSSNLSWLQTVFQKKKNAYRRYRDLSIFAFIGVYLISVIDAYVDAELSSFDISPNIGMQIEPAIINNTHQGKQTLGLQCSIKF